MIFNLNGFYLKRGELVMTIAMTSEVKVGKYLTFKIASEEYGIEILKVQEIIGIMNVTRLPRTPDFVRGVINLRGKVIPVIDMRKKFDMDTQNDTEKTCIIVVQINTDNKEVTIGIIVDEVYEVLDIDEEQIEPPPSFGSSIDTTFILGMGKFDKKVVSLLDINKILTCEDKNVVAEVSQ
jgi:purine-binding chemotaxis protein CheW